MFIQRFHARFHQTSNKKPGKNKSWVGWVGWEKSAQKLPPFFGGGKFPTRWLSQAVGSWDFVAQAADSWRTAPQNARPHGASLEPWRAGNVLMQNGNQKDLVEKNKTIISIYGIGLIYQAHKLYTICSFDLKKDCQFCFFESVFGEHIREGNRRFWPKNTRLAIRMAGIEYCRCGDQCVSAAGMYQTWWAKCLLGLIHPDVGRWHWNSFWCKQQEQQVESVVRK